MGTAAAAMRSSRNREDRAGKRARACADRFGRGAAAIWEIYSVALDQSGAKASRLANSRLQNWRRDRLKAAA